MTICIDVNIDECSFKVVRTIFCLTSARRITFDFKKRAHQRNRNRDLNIVYGVKTLAGGIS